MKIEDRLFLVKFKPDEISHLVIKNQDVCRQCQSKPCLYICPADVYGWDENLEIVTIAYEGCFECGACRIGCPSFNIEWRYPKGGYGVGYRYG